MNPTLVHQLYQIAEGLSIIIGGIGHLMVDVAHMALDLARAIIQS